MPDFNHNVRVDLVDPVMAKAFSELLQPMQNVMSRISHEYSKLKEKYDELERSNAQLRQTNQRLTDEVARLSAQAAQGPAPAWRESFTATRSEGFTETRFESFVPKRVIQQHKGPVHSVTIGAASTMDMASDLVATASWDATVKLNGLDESEPVRQLGGDQGPKTMGGLYSVAFSKTSPEVLGCTSCDKNVYLWNHKTGVLTNMLVGHTDEVNAIDFHSVQQVMVTASDDCKAIIWDFQEGLVLRKLERHDKSVYGATFLGQENQYLVATCSFDRKTRVFDMRERKVVATLSHHTDDVIGIDYSSPQNCLATSSDDGIIALWDSRTWTLQRQINTKERTGLADNEVKRVAFSPCGKSLASACSSGVVLIYDLAAAEPRQVASLSGHTDCVFDVAWGTCPETGARMLVSASHDASSRVWREVLS
mmetsp:Transcript_29474/g.84369  ORF Transcript_29474/g.84369 Transcript_29474/m.84369 type:complete len:423 (+) Transcript_29474:56-1324(+)